ncbi:hypothetical protein F5X68DRAFT_16130 [Plectosphaerella plurivora]|uniref:Uncharacterized protein n=1 Tax=Plectosphaerella plurivora TaxID=936078 RepID=A0A9P9A9X6_9PEZI|nr:hypothetical protein F5X68DRAFT_16130 [Plectosphaerella plurivora]
MGQNKQPTHGTKVDLGKDAPVTEEGPGNVKSESLAAESTKEGGGFSENKDVNTKDGKSNTRDTSKDTSKEFSSKNTSSENTSKNTSSEHSQTKSSENFSSKSTENTSKSSSGSENTKSSRGGLSNETQGGSAPTYVESQYAQDHNGPHGKNLHEGIDEADLRKAERPDPIEAAENQFVATELGEPGQKPFQAGEKTAFDALGDTQA